MALDDIANSKGIEFDELLDEIEAIVYSGTKLNIDYFLEEIMDEDHMLDIYDYFKESTTDDIDEALDAGTWIMMSLILSPSSDKVP